MKIGIDIGGNHIGIAIVNEGKILKKIEDDMKIGEKSNRENFLIQELKRLIDMILKEANLELKDIELIGIGVPGTTDGLKIINAPNIKINNFNICEELKKYYNTNIQIRNDAKCAALAEKNYGALKEYKDALFLCIGTGIGGAVFLNNVLLKPSKCDGFEIGHMVIEKNGMKCNCGREGCYEKYASMETLKNQLKEQLGKTNISIEEIQNILDNESENTIIDTFIENLSIGIENLINLFEPEAIAFGGSFSMYKGIFIKKIKEKIEQRNLDMNKNIPIFLSAQLKNNAGIIGATI